MRARGIAQFLKSKNQHKAFLLIEQLSSGYIDVLPVGFRQQWRALWRLHRRDSRQINVSHRKVIPRGKLAYSQLAIRHHLL
jgi:hypothetical protein